MGGPETVRIDLRTIVPIAAFAAIVLAIIFIELCGREDVKPLTMSPSPVDTATPLTPVPSDTPGPSPTEAPPTETPPPEPGGEERDVTRFEQLAALQQALEEFRDQEGEFPDTGGQIQSLCGFIDVDAGCALIDVIDPIPEDPLGNPGTNGYWYRSDGSTYTLWAQREAERFDECEEHPDHLADFESLMCVTGP